VATYLDVQNISKHFGSSIALDDVTFDIARGEFVCFLGPSGCGKTTLLRCIAGLEVPTSGSMRQDGRDITRLPPAERDFGIVFQSYALFPNLNAAENIGFGLVGQRQNKAQIDVRVRELLGVVGLTGHERKYPAQLSGGQQQRVALARALATSPGLLLLDEPLSALDAKVRARLRREIRTVQKRLGVTTIMVTHDQEEAQTMADRILVMRDGRVEQIGTPSDIYDRPSTPFVADFIGVMNFLEGAVLEPGRVVCDGLHLVMPTSGLEPGAPVSIAFRPEDIIVNPVGLSENTIEVVVSGIEALGSFVRLYLTSDATRVELRADIAKAFGPGVLEQSERRLRVRLPPETLRIYPKATQ
jgi:iron(III) transport system ATP-binding protein